MTKWAGGKKSQEINDVATGEWQCSSTMTRGTSRLSVSYVGLLVHGQLSKPWQMGMKLRIDWSCFAIHHQFCFSIRSKQSCFIGSYLHCVACPHTRRDQQYNGENKKTH